MITLPRRETKRMVAIHGWSGIVLGLLLYAVVLTGMVAVFAHELGEWSAGVVETRSPFTGPVDATMRDLTARTPAKYREDANIFATATNELGVFFHSHAQVDGKTVERGILWTVDRAGQVTSRREGTDEEVFGPDNAGAFGRFLVDLHVRLHLPNPWGLLLTGILGLAMLVAAISGVLIHRHLFKDIFTLRRTSAPGLAARDRHNVAGTWSLPFAFVLAFTGSFFSFTGSIGLPALAMVAFGGNEQAMFATLIGTPPAVDARPAAAANYDRIIADSSRRAGIEPDFIQVGHIGRADSTLTLNHAPREGGLETTSNVYEADTGTFRNEKPVLGTRTSLGSALFSVMGPLHFGNFAGVLSKAVWFGLGFAACYVVLTGMQLWLRRRESEQKALHRLDRTVMVVGFGLPFAIAGSALAYFLAAPLGSAVWWTPAGFLIASAAAILAGVVMPDAARLGTALRIATGILLALLPVARLLTGGPGWGAALAAGQVTLVAVDLGLLIAAAAFLYSLRRGRAPGGASAPTLQPAG